MASIRPQEAASSSRARSITALDDIAQQIAAFRSRFGALDEERSEIAERLAVLERMHANRSDAGRTCSRTGITMASPTAAKITLFRSLFRGREDVFPRRWQNAKSGKTGYAPACRNEWVRGVCAKPKVKCGECSHQAFIPVADDMIRAHLQGQTGEATGNFTAGVYPMLPDGTCWFLAADFDKRSRMRDVAAFRDTARGRGVPVAIERSRSGNGAHAWIFFAEAVPAAEARRLGALLVTATMERCPEIGFDSYDRFFPSQDTMPAGGFGNLIALPLQSGPRALGNSVFVDDEFRAYDDQWAFLSAVQRLPRDDVTRLIAKAAAAGEILGVRLPIEEDDDDRPWTAAPSQRTANPPIEGELPKTVELVQANEVYIDRTSLPPALVNRVIRMAAFQNPEFYAAQAMRLSTFGKTVVAAKLIAARDRNTLVLVHRRQLLDQWVARLQTFLDLSQDRIGVVRGGRKKPSGGVDVALMQSLVRKGVVADLVADYGHVVIDECHHVPAVGFEAIAREAKARYVLGLTATVARKDGHHPIIFMQCGPVRHRVDARKHAAARPFNHNVVFRHTAFRFERSDPDRRPAIQELYARLAADPARNDLIFDDVLTALEAGRSPLVITERKDHARMLGDRLAKFARNVLVLHGGMGARSSRAAVEALATIPEGEERVLVATGRYLGEGFDDARLDTLFLTLPIAWRGTLAQYAGRLHRLHAAKRDVVIYDYVDGNEPVLAKMAAKRATGYRALGYRTLDGAEPTPTSQADAGGVGQSRQRRAIQRRSNDDA